MPEVHVEKILYRDFGLKKRETKLRNLVLTLGGLCREEERWLCRVWGTFHTPSFLHPPQKL